MLSKLKNIIKRNLNRNIEEKNIDYKRLIKFQKEEANIVDVRSPQEYNEGHIDGAISIPEYELKSDAKKQMSNKEDIIVVYCSTGHRSKRAKETLEKLGYKNVYNLEKGIEYENF